MKKEAYLLIFILLFSVGKLAGQCLVITNPPAVCSPSTVDLTAGSITIGSAATTFTYWTDAAATSTLTTPTTVSAGTYYIKGDAGTACPDVKPVVVTVDNATVGGNVSSAQTICSGSAPANITLSGQTGAVVRWEKASDLVFTTPVTITETSTTLTGITIGSLTSNTYFRAVVKSGSCSEVASTPVLITVDPATVGGSVASAQSICSGSTPADLSLSGQTGAVMRWEKASDLVFTTPVTITETSTTLTGITIGSLTSNTYFRAVVKSGSCSEVSSTPVLITVDPATVGGSVASAQTICSGSSPADLSLSGQTGSVVRWEKSSDLAFTTPSTIAGTSTTLAGLTIGALTSNTYFRAVVKSGSCSEVSSTPVLITVDPATVGGSVASAQTICSGSSPADLSLSGQTGAVVRWEKSSDLAFTTPSSIAGTSTTLTGSTIGALTSSTYFRAIVKNGSCSEVGSAPVLITVDPLSAGGTVASDQTICNGVTPAALTASGYTGSVTGWQWDTNSGFSTPTLIGVASPTLPGATIGSLTTSTYFRAIIKSGVCAQTISTNHVKITVHDVFSSSISISGGVTTVCYNTAPATFTASGIGGDTPYTYQWYNTSGIISGATNATYNAPAITSNTGYYCAVTSHGSCGTVPTGQIDITVSPQITLSGASQFAPVCSGSTSTIILTGLLEGSTSTIDYTIDGGPVQQATTDVAVGGIAHFTTIGLLAVNNGKKLRVTGVTTGSAPSCSRAFTIETLLIVNSATTPTISGNNAPCIGSTGNVYTTETGMTGYTWNVSAGGTITGGGTGTSNTVTVTWNTSGSQTVSVNYTNSNLCTAGSPTQFSVNVSSLPTPTIISGPASPCKNSTGNVYTTQSGMLSYAWTVSAGGEITGGGTGNILVVKWNTSGSQSVTVNYTNLSGCTAAAAYVYNVSVKDLPVPAISGPATPRITSTGNVYSTSSGMTNYTWSLSGGGIITSGGTIGDNSMTVTWNNSGAQNVSVYYTDGNLCQAASPTSYPVSVKQLPSATGVSITGTAAIGNLLTGNYTYNDFFSQGTSTFRWLRNGTTAIPGAIFNTYTPVAADLDKTLTFEVTPVSLTGTPFEGLAVTSSPTAMVEDLSGYPVADEVCIEGVRTGGAVLKGKYRYTYIKPEGTSTYRWLRNGSAIPGATGLQYTLIQFDDIDSKADITFEVTPVSTNIIPRAGSPVVSRPLARMTLPVDEYSVAVSEVPLTVNETGGVFSGPGVTNGRFSPSDVGTTGSPYLVNYLLNIVNSSTTCSQQASESIKVIANTTTFTGVNPVYCTNGSYDVISISGNPVSAISYGFFLSNSSAIVSQTMWTVTIDPTKLQPGVNTDVLYFYYLNSGYFYMISQPLVVESEGTDFKFINLNPAYCAQDAKQAISIVGTYPAGGTGTFSGSILSNLTNTTADLDPKSGTPGTTYTISFQYQSPGGCLSSVLTTPVIINPLPNPNFSLDPYYNVDGPDVPVVPVQSGGIFSGKGISGERLFPSIGGLGERTITYTITDDNSCTNSKDNKTTILKAEGTFTGIPAIICYGDLTYTVKVKDLPKGRTVTSFTNLKNSIVHSPGDTTAVYSVVAAGAGIDVLTLTYKLDNVDYSISTEINIDLLEQVEIRNLLPGDVICNNITPFELITSYKNGEFLSGPVTAGYLDPTKAIGNTAITYKYTNQKTGCYTSVTVPFSIIQAPVLSFDIADKCIENSADSIRFINTSSSAGLINNWIWEFSDGGNRYSTKKDPANLYKTGGIHTVSVTAKTANNCSVTKLFSFDLGVKPVAKFHWLRDCMSSADSLILHDGSTFDSPITSRTWKFMDGTPDKTDTVIKIPKKATGYFPVKLVVKTSYQNCSDSVIKNIYIRPTISLATDDYFENFENGKGGWVINEETGTSWLFGKPDRTVINSAASGNNAWYTPVTLTTQKLKASVVSPCFDFSDSERPMIRLSMFKRFNRDGDGAVIQYRIGDDPSWQSLGTIDDGIVWYNSNLIKGNPGDAPLGWTSKGTQDIKWTESRHTLDELVGKENVKLRIAYGSDGYGTENEGVAFDDIWIGERTRKVLLEHFVNTSSTSSSRATAMVDQVATDRASDIINIQYHTNFPGSDPFYDKNPGESGARILFYGLAKIPYTFIDGGSNKPEFASRFDYNLADLDSNDVIRRSLINPKFDISISTNITGGVLTVSGVLKALEDIDVDNLTLYLVVTEKENNKYSGANGEKIFYNVFRKFIPDAGGISLKKEWLKGESLVISNQSWIVDKILNAADINVIAFVQNNVTKDLYQSVAQQQKAISVGIDNLKSNEGVGFSVFPNPASDRLTIKFGEALKNTADIRIYDTKGTVIRTYKTGSGDTEFLIDGLGLSDGIYLIRVTSGGKDEGFKKLIVHNN